MHSVAPHRDHGGMQAFAQERQHAQPSLAVIPARILHGDGRFPIELRHQFKWEARSLMLRAFLAGSNVMRMLIYRYSGKQ